MKWIAALLFLFSFSELYAQSPSKQVLRVETKIYCDHCLDCESCDENIFNRVHALNKGITKIRVKPAENAIYITYKPQKTNPQAIRQSISMAGFDADDLPADAEAQQKLDACCKPKD